MKLGDLAKELFHLLPTNSWQIDEDNNGQIIIYTGFKEDPNDDSIDPELVLFEEEEE